MEMVKELIVKVLAEKLATRTELAELIKVHPDTISGLKSGKKTVSEKKALEIIEVINTTYFPIIEEPIIEEPTITTDDEAGRLEGKETTVVELIANDTGINPRKIRRVLRQLFGKLSAGQKQWALTSEQYDELILKLTK